MKSQYLSRTMGDCVERQLEGSQGDRRSRRESAVVEGGATAQIYQAWSRQVCETSFGLTIDSSEFLFAGESWHSLLQVEANFDRAEECWIIHVINLAIPQLVSRVCALICLLHPRVHPLRQGFAFAKETVRTDHRTFVEVYVKTKRHTPRQYTLLDVSTAVALDPSRR